MELRVEPVTFPEVIQFNYEELKAEITSKVEMYKNLVYTGSDQIKDAKADRAALNKLIKAMSDETIDFIDTDAFSHFSSQIISSFTNA